MTDHTQRMQARLAEMLEATRLTGAGRLQDATTLIQRSLSGAVPSPAARAPAAKTLSPPTIDLVAERVETRPAAESASVTEARLVPERVREAVEGVVRGLGRGVAPVLKGLGGQGPGLQGLGLEGLGGQGRNAFRDAPRSSGRGEPGEFLELSFSGSTGARDYKLYVPTGRRENMPLVVMLHGCKQSPDDFAAGTAMNALAESEGFLVAYPAQSSRANGHRCWNWFEAGDQGRETGEAGIIAGITRAVVAEHPVDPKRVYIAGLSAGAAAAANVAQAYPDLYAAVGIHSGLAAGCARDLSSALMAMNMGAPGTGLSGGFGAPVEGLGIPAIVIHGDGDKTVNPRNGEEVLAQAGADGPRLRQATESGTSPGGLAYSRTRYSDEAGRARIESWLVHGLGHAWSGGDPSGSYTDPRGPDASRAMLAFFLEHSLAAGRA